MQQYACVIFMFLLYDNLKMITKSNRNMLVNNKNI